MKTLLIVAGVIVVVLILAGAYLARFMGQLHTYE